MSSIELKTTKNFKFLYDNHVNNNTRVSILEGGSRSGKTWSIIQFLLIYCYANRGQGLTIIIARDFLTSLKATILPDFKEILLEYGIFRDANFNKSEMIYNLYGNTIRFMGLDNADKVHGAKSNILWINEAISSDKDIVLQLQQRCSDFIIFDYNPSTSQHWVYDLELRDDSKILKTTLLDNPFIPDEVRKQILSYEPTDKNKELGTADEFMWKVYGLGERADGEAVIFRKYDVVDSVPDSYDRIVYGLDYGYTNDPTACIEVILDGNNIYLNEILYSTGLLNSDIYNAIAPVVQDKIVIPDSAEPKSNDYLLYEGLKIIPAEKGRDSIMYGIDLMRSKKIHITANSTNLIKEFKNYIFVKKNGVVTNKPIDNFNHGIDACRYAIMYLLKKHEEIII
jgi:phage terminase large subunit